MLIAPPSDTYEDNGTDSRDMTDTEKTDPSQSAQPRYWVKRSDVDLALQDRQTRNWLFGFRGITNATNERSFISAIAPKVAAGNSFPLFLLNIDPQKVAALVGNFSCLAFDFVARQKIGGSNLNLFLVRQFPALQPDKYSGEDIKFVVSRVLELTYTATDLAPFANDLGYKGKPFQWDTHRRALLRAELDAYYAKLYGLTRDELRYILDPSDVYGDDYPSVTFPGLKRNEVRDFGEYRTRRLVLEAWDKYCAQ